jgi:short-subunit dehydrogenase
VNRPIRDWRERRVWIVGASSGIGEALARELLVRQARVALSARSRERLERVAESSPRALVLPLDVRTPEAFAPALGSIVDAWGGVDLVIFMAGTYSPARAWDIDPQRVRETVDINLTGLMSGAAAVVPRLLAQGEGAIAIVASVAGYRGLPQAAIYGPTKAALINFAETLYIDLAPKGLSVFLVCPGFVATPLTAQNTFRMPALISAQEAADAMLRGFSEGRFEIHFPKRFTRLLKLLRLLPYRLYFPLVRRLTGL